MANRTHEITGVPTSITAFVGLASQGLVSEPVTLHSFADFKPVFGGPRPDSMLSDVVLAFFQNGGSQAIIVGVKDTATSGPSMEELSAGLFALDKVDLFNLLCLPPYKIDGNVDPEFIALAGEYVERRRAMLLVDAPSDWTSPDAANAGIVAGVGTNSNNAALFFPRLRRPNPLRGNQLDDYAPAGAIAGVFARLDAQQGVWNAPAGPAAALLGVPQLSVSLTDGDSEVLNLLGVNCLRGFADVGSVIWGSHTLGGAGDCKYIPVRRMALYIEESLSRGTQWVVFEPNGEPLWAQIRDSVIGFMLNLFQQGALQGVSPSEGYFVKCDSTTTTQADIDQGLLNILVGFAPLKPAEFVIIQIQQMMSM